MAITIIKQPQKLQPVYNEMVFVVSSTNVLESNFRFVSTISSNGVLLATVKYPANPDGYGVLDVHKHLQSQISHDYNDSSDPKYAKNSAIKYEVTFAEEFRPYWEFDDNLGSPQIGFIGQADPNSLFVVGDEVVVSQDAPYTNPSYNGKATVVSITYNNSVSAWHIVINKTTKLNTPAEGGTISLSNFRSRTFPVEHVISDKVAFNGVQDYLDFINWDSDVYADNTPSTNPQTQMLTSLDFSGDFVMPIRKHSKIKLNAYFENDGTSTLPMKIETFTLNPFSITRAYLYQQPPYNQGECIMQYSLGLDQINSSSNLYTLDQGVYTPAIQPFFPDDTEFLIVTPSTGIGQDVKRRMLFEILKEEDYCTKYEDIQLVFMDKLGSFLPFHFDLVNRHSMNIEKTNYQTDYGKYAPASSGWKYNSYDRGTSSLDTVVTDTYRVTSNWITEADSEWLMQIFTSPEVYWVKEDGTSVAINITTSSVERKQKINDQLINYTLEFQLSNKNKQQLG